MQLSIVILEDNADRESAMRSRVAERFPQYALRFFSTANSMIDWLAENLQSTIVISLDNDLEPQPDVNGHACDAGAGRDVAEYLLRQEPVCPVVVHSSNYNAAIAMEADLQDAGWPTVRVTPYEDVRWIDEEWFVAMRDAMVNLSVGRAKPDEVSRLA